MPPRTRQITVAFVASVTLICAGCSEDDATSQPGGTPADTGSSIDMGRDTGQLDTGQPDTGQLVDTAPACTEVFYRDFDTDSFGDPDQPQTACTQPSGFVANADDCNDQDRLINPEADEVCDELDNNCDDIVDTDAIALGTWYRDVDGDGHGDVADTVEACSEPEGYVRLSDDCDDGSEFRSPSLSELCDGIDNDCDPDELVDDGIPGDGDGCTDAGPPDLPETIGHLTLSIRTGPGENDGTDENSLSVCLNADECFKLDNTDVDDFRRGEIDVFHIEEIVLLRSAVDRFEIRSANGTDRWNPTCMQMEFDGEPVYCRDGLDLGFGDDSGVGELASWTDPDGLHLDCRTCFDSSITHGPMVGNVTDEDVRLWVRTDATRSVAVRVTPDETQLATMMPTAFVYPRPGRDYTHEVEISGLSPETTYYYQMTVAGTDDETAVYSFHTPPPAGEPVELSFSFGSCTRLAEQPIFTQVLDTEPDLFLFVGDNHYANTSEVDRLRFFYRWSRERPARAARAEMLAQVPTLAVWDDHDYTGNNTLGDAVNKERSLRIFDEYWANPSAGTEAIPGIFFRYQYGDIDFFMLDDRYYRGSDDSILGTPQTEWLEDELLRSDAAFKFVVSGSQFNPTGSNDSWAVYPDATERFFDFIARNEIGGVVFLSGDVHFTEFRSIERTDDGGYDLPELTSSPMANTNSDCWTDAGSRSCFDWGDFFIEVRVNSTLADPELTAQVIDTEGFVRSQWTIRRSDLEVP